MGTPRRDRSLKVSSARQAPDRVTGSVRVEEGGPASSFTKPVAGFPRFVKANPLAGELRIRWRPTHAADATTWLLKSQC